MCVATWLPQHVRIKRITSANFWSNGDPYQVVQLLLYPGSIITCFAGFFISFVWPETTAAFRHRGFLTHWPNFCKNDRFQGLRGMKWLQNYWSLFTVLRIGQHERSKIEIMGFSKADVDKLREFASRFSWEDNLRIKKCRRESNYWTKLYLRHNSKLSCYEEERSKRKRE